MVKVHEQLCAVLKRDLSITDLFQYPSVSRLAAFVGDGADTRAPEAVEDRAGKQRTAMNRRIPARRPVVPAKSGKPKAEAALGNVVMHSRLHPGQVSRMRRLVR